MMKLQHKILTSSIILMAALGLTGCATSSNTSTTTGQETSSAKVTKSAKSTKSAKKVVLQVKLKVVRLLQAVQHRTRTQLYLLQQLPVVRRLFLKQLKLVRLQ